MPTERSNELKKIKSIIEGNFESSTFGVILGPSGTGKTYLTRKACNESLDSSGNKAG